MYLGSFCSLRFGGNGPWLGLMGWYLQDALIDAYISSFLSDIAFSMAKNLCEDSI